MAVSTVMDKWIHQAKDEGDIVSSHVSDVIVTVAVIVDWAPSGSLPGTWSKITPRRYLSFSFQT